MKIVGSSGAALLAGVLSLPAGAADWEMNPTLEAGYLYDDNYRLASPGNEIKVSGPLADAQLEMRALTQTGEFSFTPRVRATYFPSETSLDAVDYFANVDWLHHGQRFESRVLGEFADQVGPLAGAERVEQVRDGRLIKSHRRVLLGVHFGRYTPSITPVAHPVMDRRNPTTPGTPTTTTALPARVPQVRARPPLSSTPAKTRQ